MFKMFKKEKKEERNTVKDMYNCVDFENVTIDSIEQLMKRTQNLVYSTNKEA